MRNRFDRQLADLNQQLIDMGELCEIAIAQATSALKNGDEEAARDVILADGRIDQAERDIEHLCLKLLLQQQPVAKDLRQVSAALKMITDMERIGDQAADIAEIVKSSDTKLVRGFPQLLEMSQKTTEMVADSVKAFVGRNLALAESINKMDDFVDERFMDLRKGLLEFIIHADEVDAQKALDLIMIGKYLERIGDHATNIAEWVSFSITGVHDGAFDTKPL